MKRCIGYFGAAAVLSAGLAWAQASSPTAHAEFEDLKGKAVGRAELRETPNGVLATVELEGLPAGTHAFHVHEVGTCEPPFESAGGHYAPHGNKHGYEDPNGPHAGDLPNIVVPESGELSFDVLIDRVTLKEGEATLLDRDGSAFVIHQGADDYSTDPAGNAGDRIACAVIQNGNGRTTQ